MLARKGEKKNARDSRYGICAGGRHRRFSHPASSLCDPDPHMMDDVWAEQPFRDPPAPPSRARPAARAARVASSTLPAQRTESVETVEASDEDVDRAERMLGEIHASVGRIQEDHGDFLQQHVAMKQMLETVRSEIHSKRVEQLQHMRIMIGIACLGFAIVVSYLDRLTQQRHHHFPHP